MADSKLRPRGPPKRRQQALPPPGRWRLRAAGGVFTALAGGLPLGAHGDRASAGPGKETSASANTINLRKDELKMRRIGYSALFGGGVVALGVAGLVGVYKRSGRLSLGPLEYRRGQGCLCYGKLICCAVERKHQLRRVEEQEDHDHGSIDALLAAGEDSDKIAEMQHRFLQMQSESYEKNAEAVKRRFMLLSGLFVSYVGCSVGIPWAISGHASCKHGFFWEDHLPFFSTFCITKAFEIYWYVADPTLQGDLSLVDFMMKFAPSCLGYLDGYTDATAIVIAHSCPMPFAQTLALTMSSTYLIGVVAAQWVVVAVLAARDPSHACLMKLLHMDALAACVSLPEEMKRTWYIVNMVRTFGEDLPQAVQQTLFLLYVRKNPFMIASVLVSVASSAKAVYDAVHRNLLATGAKVVDAADNADAQADARRDEELREQKKLWADEHRKEMRAQLDADREAIKRDMEEERRRHESAGEVEAPETVASDIPAPGPAPALPPALASRPTLPPE